MQSPEPDWDNVVIGQDADDGSLDMNKLNLANITWKHLGKRFTTGAGGKASRWARHDEKSMNLKSVQRLCKTYADSPLPAKVRINFDKFNSAKNLERPLTQVKEYSSELALCRD